MPGQPSAGPQDPTTDPGPQPAAGARSLPGRLLILLFLMGVVVTECAVAYMFLLPSRAETAAMVGYKVEPDVAVETPPSEEVPAEPTPPSQVEVDLGQFGVSAYQPVSNTTLRIDFRLYGTVAVEEEKEFLTQMEGNNHRFRDQVIVIVRSSDITDLTDAGLGLIKRKILEKSNALLGKRYLQSVVFSDFSFIEQ